MVFFSITSGVNTSTYFVKLCPLQAKKGRREELKLHILVRSSVYCYHKTQQYDPIFDVSLDVTVNITKVFIVTVKKKHWVPFALFPNYWIFRTVVKNDKY